MYKKDLDLTEGVIWKTLIIFTLPILAGNFFQHLYTAADAVIVGKLVVVPSSSRMISSE